MSYPKSPKPFLNVVTHDGSKNPPLVALCAGYELEMWRTQAFTDHIMEWLPEFALSAEELKDFDASSGVRLIRKAAQLVYQTEKYQLRGEFGELLLHIALRQVHKSIPAISKIYYKDSVNNTVKGFDAVHVVEQNKKLELWLGEVKFYESASRAATDVIEELKVHTATNYLRNEFMLITNKLDRQADHYEKLTKLLDPNTSLDDVFEAVCIPVLITYDSDVVQSHKKADAIYTAALLEELEKIFANFKRKLPAPMPIKLHLFLIPLHTKKDLVAKLHESMKKWQ